MSIRYEKLTLMKKKVFIHINEEEKWTINNNEIVFHTYGWGCEIKNNKMVFIYIYISKRNSNKIFFFVHIDDLVLRK